MGRVLARRDENWKKLQQYILDEQERFRLTGPDGARLYGFDRELHLVHPRGHLRPQPARVRRRDHRRGGTGDGRSRLDRARERRASGARESARAKASAAEAAATRRSHRPSRPDAVAAAACREMCCSATLEPRFVSAAYFLRFKFDPGHYALAGRERLNDRDVLQDRVLPVEALHRGPDAAEPARARTGRRDRREDEQGLAGHAWIDPSRAPDPAVHVRQHRHGLPARAARSSASTI